MGRRINPQFTSHKFTLVKSVDAENGKRYYYAICNECKTTLKNTSSRRLENHRKACLSNTKRLRKKKGKSSSSVYDPSQVVVVEVSGKNSDRHESHGNNECDGVTETVTFDSLDLNTADNCSVEVVLGDAGNTVGHNFTPGHSFFLPNAYSSSPSSTASTSKSSSSFARSKSSPVSANMRSTVNLSTIEDVRSHQTPNYHATNIHKRKMGQIVDTISTGDVQTVTQALGDLFFGCNIPFSVVESVHFRNFVEKLRPAYESYIPSKTVLSTTILDDAYEHNLQECRNTVEEEVVILIDGWRVNSNDTRIVTAMAHTAYEKCFFIDSWQVSNLREDYAKLLEIVDESVKICKEMYNFKAYAVVSDSNYDILRIGRNGELWHSTCSSHTARLLGKDLVERSINKDLYSLIENLKTTDVENALLQNGGTLIKGIADTRLCTYKDAAQSILENVPLVRQIMVNNHFKESFAKTIEDLIFNYIFFEELESFLKASDPVCKLINACQTPNTSIADAAKLWLEFDPAIAEHRRMEALNVYAMTALYLHPQHHEVAKLYLSREQLIAVKDFSIEELDREGLKEMADFEQKQGVHSKLLKKGLDAVTYWKIAKNHSPVLSRWAIKLLSLPASSAQIDRLFTNLSFVHSPPRNKLTPERFKKLVHVYHTLKNLDTSSDEY